MPRITIPVAYGGGTVPVTIENDTAASVADVFNQVAATLGIGSGENVTVNGLPADLDTELDDGDEVAFTKAGGRKGDVA
jgi:molybdopterin converting factor small subunit